MPFCKWLRRGPIAWVY